MLVLTRPEILGHLSAVTVAPITRTIRGLPNEVLVGIESGLKVTSAEEEVTARDAEVRELSLIAAGSGAKAELGEVSAKAVVVAQGAPAPLQETVQVGHENS